MLDIIPAPNQPSGPRTRETVDVFAVQVYEFVLSRPGVTREAVGRALDAPWQHVDDALEVLRGLRLVKAPVGPRDGLVAVDPEAAQIELMVPLERAIHDNRRRLAGVQGQLQSFMAAFHDRGHDRPRGGTVVVTDDAEEIELRLVEAAHRCTREILLMQPCVAQEHPELRQAHPLILDALQRGVRVRVLYPHTARGDAGTRSRIRELVAAGGEVRTSREIHRRSLVFDRNTAFVPAESTVDADTGATEESGTGVTAVYEPAVATFLGSLHDLVWEPAFPLETATVGYGDVRNDLRSTILELLAAGIKDDAIARRIGLSERSLRRHVAAIMRDLAAGSRFQAGVMAARSGLVDPVRAGTLTDLGEEGAA
ncbi:LuxR C-terminal-related transcriptional regulator [Streptomyces sp. NPDC060223]|uniref:helix-turn-helix transcriptional regulator n=1 Tax=unclassified Streptomyces TaxID=2593676 RepID=UPI00363276EC